MKLIVSPAPHAHSGDSVQKNMLNVIIALMPAFAVAMVAFGWGALITTGVSVVSCIVFEWLITKFLLKQKGHICDLSAVLTGLLLAFNLPSNLPIWIVIIGALVAIGVGKMAFGGLGQNPFNPALVGRVFLLISFPVQMTTWPCPQGFDGGYLDAKTAATPLTLLKEVGPQGVDLLKCLTGMVGGSLGEVSAAALLLGFIYLLATKTITWHIPVSIFATVSVFAAAFAAAMGLPVGSFVGTTLCAGGLMLGAIYMATDYVTSPMTHCGQIVYGIGIGLIVMIIRCWGAYPEGMSFAILIMNAVTPLLNMYIHPKRFGEKKK